MKTVSLYLLHCSTTLWVTSLTTVASSPTLAQDDCARLTLERFSSVGRTFTSVTEPSVLLDLESGTLQSAGGRFRFLVPPSGTTCLSTLHLRRHSRFQTTTQDFSVFPFLPRHYHMTRVLLSPFITTVWTPAVLVIINIIYATLKMFMMMTMMMIFQRTSDSRTCHTSVHVVICWTRICLGRGRTAVQCEYQFESVVTFVATCKKVYEKVTAILERVPETCKMFS